MRHGKGDEWFYSDDGFVIIDGVMPRTKGLPITAHTILTDNRIAIFEAARITNLSPSFIIALIAKESGPRRKSRKGVHKAKPTGHRDNVSIRTEDEVKNPYRSDEETPNRISAGLMQTLLSTAQAVNDRFEVYLNLDGSVKQLTRYDLMSPEVSIMLGSLYCVMLMEENETEDIMLLQAAYNAGAVYSSKKNRWNLRMYGAQRFEMFAAYYNDARVVMRAHTIKAWS